jgi:hypothetical protein
MPYLTPADIEKIPMQELYWPAGVAGVANRPLAVVSGLAAAAGIPAAEVSPEAAAGPVEVYVDNGADFINGPKEVALTRSARDGLSLVRLRVDGVGARRVRIDPAGRRGLLRLDWLTIGFHVNNAVQAHKITFTSLSGASQVELHGLRLLQPNLLEIVSDDPQIVYTIDLAAQPHLAGTYAIDVEMAFAWLGIRSDPLAVDSPASHRTTLVRRTARTVVRQLGGLR